jgi:hypothetical protein
MMETNIEDLERQVKEFIDRCWEVRKKLEKKEA